MFNKSGTEVENQRREYLYKVLVIGDIGVGKTSLIHRYVHGIFSQQYKSTIGVDFALKVIKWDENTTVRLQLWDIAGQERFGNMTRVYYKEAVGAFIVFDVTRVSTFEAVQKWKADLEAKVNISGTNEPIPVVLLANKIDLAKEEFMQVQNNEKMDQFCKDNNFVTWFGTSAKDNTNIDRASKTLVQAILESVKKVKEDIDPGVINFNGDDESSEKKMCPCSSSS